MHALVLLGTAGIVTGARSVLLSTVPSFAEATNASNKQVQCNVVCSQHLPINCKHNKSTNNLIDTQNRLLTGCRYSYLSHGLI